MASELPKVAVVGVTGYIGGATVRALSAGGDVSVVGVVRDPDSDKAAPFKELANVTLVAGNMAEPASLAAGLAGVQSAFIVTPGTENRSELATNAVNAAKEAGVPHIVVVSVVTAGDESHLFGRQFKELEANVVAAGIPYTLLRLPIFTDNNWAQAGAIKGTGKFYGPQDPSKPQTTVAVQDVADAAAVLLKDPAPHAGRTYTIVSPAYTTAELAEAFTKSLGKPVEYVQVPYEAAKKSFMDMGMPEWQVDGYMELLHLLDAGSFVFVSDDFKTITGREPTTIQAWVEAVKGGFSE